MLITCKECQHQISNKAFICPNCGYQLRRKPLGCLGAIGYLSLTFLACVLFLAYEKRNDQHDIGMDNLTRSSAAGGCMLFIKQALHDPDSAIFENSDKAYIVLKKNKAMVIRSVRAKNAFNAMRKENYVCFIEMQGDKIESVLIAQQGTQQDQIIALLKKWNINQK